MNAVASSQILDQKFIVAAAAIGTVYAAVVATLGAMVGKEAAGVAGVALTALATAIFKQFETLRFRQISEEDRVEVQVPKLSWWRLIAFASCFMGLKVFFGMIAGVLLASTNLMPKMTGMESFVELLSDWRVLVAVIGINVIVYILGGFVIAKAFRIQTYSTLLIAAFISCVLEGLLPLIPIAIQEFSLFIEVLTSGALWPASFWLIFVGAALLGAKLANRVLFLSAKAPTEA